MRPINACHVPITLQFRYRTKKKQRKNRRILPALGWWIARQALPAVHTLLHFFSTLPFAKVQLNVHTILRDGSFQEPNLLHLCLHPHLITSPVFFSFPSLFLPPFSLFLLLLCYTQLSCVCECECMWFLVCSWMWLVGLSTTCLTAWPIPGVKS